MGPGYLRALNRNMLKKKKTDHFSPNEPPINVNREFPLPHNQCHLGKVKGGEGAGKGKHSGLLPRP